MKNDHVLLEYSIYDDIRDELFRSIHLYCNDVITLNISDKIYVILAGEKECTIDVQTPFSKS